MSPDDLRAWRKGERARLIARREDLDAPTLERLRQRIDTHLERAFPGLAAARLAFCWPIRGEYDARPLMQRLRERGALTVLPVVIARGQPLVFRRWDPDVALAEGPLGIPYPATSEPVAPTAILLPLIGWDAAGHRLGYGAGYFDRTLAALAPRPALIGVGYELSRIATIHPQPWDVPLDWVVTEGGVYRRDPQGLVYLGEAAPGAPGALASPVCYADEIAPGHFGEGDERA
jgi:5,10-methenyltetrahydrofolate synthetase